MIHSLLRVKELQMFVEKYQPATLFINILSHEMRYKYKVKRLDGVVSGVNSL